jgi:hypothetical protein
MAWRQLSQGHMARVRGWSSVKGTPSCHGLTYDSLAFSRNSKAVYWSRPSSLGSTSHWARQVVHPVHLALFQDYTM